MMAQVSMEILRRAMSVSVNRFEKVFMANTAHVLYVQDGEKIDCFEIVI